MALEVSGENLRLPNTLVYEQMPEKPMTFLSVSCVFCV